MSKLLFFVVSIGLLLNKIDGDPASHQLENWATQHTTIDRCTDFNGIPYPSLTASLAVGTNGPILMMDRSLLERTASFNRERIPERPVHAKGTAAHGTFTVTHDISKWTKAKFLNGIGKKTPIFLRFSLTAAEIGFPDTIRDSIGFAVKFYTEDGNHDIAGIQHEVFPIRDPINFVDINRSRKRNPQTHLRDANMFWDFVQKRPETVHHLLRSFSDINLPENLRVINGSGVHTFQLVNAKGEAFYCKFHFISQQPFVGMSNKRAMELAGTEPNYFQKDLYNAIEMKNYPKWTVAIQVATFKEAENYRWDFLDITKNWREEDFPKIPVGILELNRNMVDFFKDSEQAAFDPANMVPGIEASPDRMLHARMMAYHDSQRYRLGVNHDMLPINKPLNKVASYERDGKMCFGDNGNGGPNYHPNSFHGPEVDTSAKQKPFWVDGEVGRFDTKDEDNFSQAQLYINVDTTSAQRQYIATNMGAALAQVTSLEVRENVFRNCLTPVSRTFAVMVRRAMTYALRHPIPPISGRTA